MSPIHTDVCGPITTSVRDGYMYFIMFMDDLLRYGYIFMIRRKSESFEVFNRYHNEVKKQIGKSIKTFRSDRGSEYLSNEFMTYLKKNGIIS